MAADPVVSPADTIRRCLTSKDYDEFADGIDALDALLAVGERDRQQIARLTEALAGLVASVRYRPPHSDWLAWRSECIDGAKQLLTAADLDRAEKMFLRASDFDDLNPRAVLAGEEDAGDE